MAKQSRQQRKKATAHQVAGPTMAELADRHELYENSVQNAETEVDFVSETFEEIRGRKLKLLREDFCGTASVCCEWVKRGNNHRAIGVDLDEEVLQWGREHNLAKLTDEQQSRVSLLQEDVLKTNPEKADAILAMNFSYWYFKTRDVLRGYFEHVREGLVDDGVFFLDIFGGFEAFQLLEEETENEGFTYIWDQSEYNPITGDYVCHIHFDFPDGSKLKEAFTYVWRLWTLPEIRELLSEAGFSKVTTYWEGTDEDGESGNGEYEATEEGEADAGWVCYIAAEK